MSNGIDRFLLTSSFLSLFLSLSFLHRSFFLFSSLSFFLLFYNDDHPYERQKKKTKKNTQRVKHQSSCKLSVICLSTFYIYTKDSKEKKPKASDDRRSNQHPIVCNEVNPLSPIVHSGLRISIHSIELVI